MQSISEKEATKNPTLEQLIGKESKSKELIVNYVGEKFDNENVTVQMIVDTLADEFPELILAVAEENWIRGYHQALEDVDAGREQIEEQEG